MVEDVVGLMERIAQNALKERQSKLPRAALIERFVLSLNLRLFGSVLEGLVLPTRPYMKPWRAFRFSA